MALLRRCRSGYVYASTRSLSRRVSQKRYNGILAATMIHPDNRKLGRKICQRPCVSHKRQSNAPRLCRQPDVPKVLGTSRWLSCPPDQCVSEEPRNRGSLMIIRKDSPSPRQDLRRPVVILSPVAVSFCLYCGILQHEWRLAILKRNLITAARSAYIQRTSARVRDEDVPRYDGAKHPLPKLHHNPLCFQREAFWLLCCSTDDNALLHNLRHHMTEKVRM